MLLIFFKLTNYFVLLSCFFYFYYFADCGLGQWKDSRKLQIHQSLMTLLESRNKENGCSFCVGNINGMCAVNEY